MKNLFLVIIFCVCTVVTAQNVPPLPPLPPVSVSCSNSSSSSVSIKSTNSVYKFRASFDSSKTEKVADLLTNKLGKSYSDKTTKKWIKSNGGNTLYECTLDKGRLRMFLDKELSDDKTIALIENLGSELRDAISGVNTKERVEKEIERSKKEIERAKRELERAKRQLERINKQNIR